MEFPKPSWEPEHVEDPDVIIDRMIEFTDRKRAFVAFRFGTVVFSDSSAACPDADYKATLVNAVQQSPDFKVIPMNDGNFLVRFAGPVTGLVLSEFYKANESDIVKAVENGGLLPGETVLTLKELSVPREHYYVGLYARAKLFRDASEPQILKRFVP